MKVTWRGVWAGVKVGLGIAIKLSDAHLIKVKGMDKVKTVKEIVDDVDAVMPKAKPHIP